MSKEYVVVGDIGVIPKDIRVYATYKDGEEFKDRYLFTAKIEERDYYEPYGEEDFILINTFYAPVTIYEGKFQTAYCNNFNEFVTEVGE
jgi:hypothetical protein